MKNKIIKSEFYRTIMSPLFWIIMPLIIFFCFMSCYEELKHIKNSDVAYVFDIMLGLGAFKNMIIFLAPLPYISTFCNDINSNFINNQVIRCGLRNYSITKIFVNIIVTFSFVFFGLMVFVLLLNVTNPLFVKDNHIELAFKEPYGHLLLSNSPILYFATISFLLSLSSAFWSTIALYITSFIPNKFIATSAPFISYYLLGEIGEFLPNYFNFRMLANGFKVLPYSSAINFIYTVIFFIFLILIISYLFVKNVKRRIGNELI